MPAGLQVCFHRMVARFLMLERREGGILQQCCCYITWRRTPILHAPVFYKTSNRTQHMADHGWLLDWLPMVTSAHVLNAKFHETISEFHDLGRPNDERMRRQQSTSAQLSHGEFAKFCETKHP